MNEALAAIAVLHLLAAVGLRGTFHPVVAMEDGVVTMEKRMPQAYHLSTTGEPVYGACARWELKREDVFGIIDLAEHVLDYGVYYRAMSFLRCTYSLYIVRDHRIYGMSVESTGGFCLVRDDVDYEWYVCFDFDCRPYFVNEFFGDDVSPWNTQIPDPRNW